MSEASLADAVAHAKVRRKPTANRLGAGPAPFVRPDINEATRLWPNALQRSSQSNRHQHSCHPHASDAATTPLQQPAEASK
jgi:hypothetical protein